MLQEGVGEVQAKPRKKAAVKKKTEGQRHHNNEAQLETTESGRRGSKAKHEKTNQVPYFSSSFSV